MQKQAQLTHEICNYVRHNPRRKNLILVIKWLHRNGSQIKGSNSGDKGTRGNVLSHVPFVQMQLIRVEIQSAVARSREVRSVPSATNQLASEQLLDTPLPSYVATIWLIVTMFIKLETTESVCPSRSPFSDLFTMSLFLPWALREISRISRPFLPSSALNKQIRARYSSATCQPSVTDWIKQENLTICLWF